MSGSILDFDEDLSTVEAPPPLPQGQYLGDVTSATPSEGAAGEYVAVTFHVPADRYPADFEGDPDGINFVYRFVPWGDRAKTAQGKWRMRKFQEAIGARLSKSVDLTDWLGLSGMVEIRHKDFEGEKRGEIARVVPA